MKLIAFFSLFVLGIVANAQNKRFSYEYKFIPDSTNISEVKTEIMKLDVTESGSKFYSYIVYNSDSLAKIDLEKQLATTGMINLKSDMQKGLVRYSVTKNYPKYEVFLHDRILSDFYKVSEERELVWKVSSEKLKIGDWITQKAETDFGGRHWFAWFTTDIPIQDGPYKFYGLPGLIVKIEDKSGFHKIELKGIKNNTLERDILAFEFEKPIKLDYKKYQTVYKNYRKDPMANLKKKAQEGQFYVTDDAGNKLDNKDYVKSQEKMMMDRMKKNNNILELDLLK